MPRPRTPVIFIVSDGRGETAGQVLKAAAVQFEGRPYRRVVRAGITTPEAVVAVVKEAAAEKAVVVYTLVAEETRAEMRRQAARRLVPTVDVLGPAFSALHDQFKTRRGETPGLLYALERDRFDRMAAIDYTLEHDDGQRPHELGKADVVLVGVSRASKSSTCFYLANHGVRAANVPLVPDLPLPPQLVKLPPERVVGLRVGVDRLMIVREARAREFGAAWVGDYATRRAVARELLWAHAVMDENGWRHVDASYMAIEEIAKEVLRLRRLTPKVPW